MQANSNPDKARKDVWRGTDKALQADRKNRLEVFKLQFYEKMLERQSIKARFFINREQRKMVKDMFTMKKTSGISTEGVPCTGPNDKLIQGSRHFRPAVKFNERRLTRWRSDERPLERYLKLEYA